MTGDRDRGSAVRSAWQRGVVAASLGIGVILAVTLHFMGRRLWCQCGTWSPWSWDIWSMHNSQHLLDPYTFTHVLHGLLSYALLWLILGARWPNLRLLAAVVFEAVWEVAENTNFVIEAYRESTVSLNYYGDSIINSLGDLAAFALGYTAAAWLPVWVSAAGFLAVELLLVVTIRDSLLVNILMLLHPFEAVKKWQIGA